MNEISVNSVLESAESGQLIRVLWVSKELDTAYVFNIETGKMPELVSYAELKQLVFNGNYAILTIDPYQSIVTESQIPEIKRQARDRVWELMEQLVSDEPKILDKQGRNLLLAEAIKRTGKSRITFQRYLRTYWKRGKTKNAFIPDYQKRGGKGKEHKSGDAKIGRPRIYSNSSGVNVNDVMKSIFEDSIRKYYHNRKENTLQYAYDMMIKEHFTQFTKQNDGSLKAEIFPENETPTIAQFRYWYNKRHNVTEKITKRKGEAKFSLDHRAILGKSDFEVMGPGAKYQIDATIGDIYLVSRFNRADIIGRPVIYFVIDVYSRMVAGMYVGLEGPSWVGAMMAIANAASDKAKYCAEYGIEITDKEWPCQGVPGAILGDRGEMESKSVETLINALNVRIENAPPFRADMKGIVEQHFNTINGTALARLPGHVKPDMSERGGHDYRLDAKLDVQQLTKILIQCVLYHNNHHLLESYERTEDMIKDGVTPIPLELWNWGITHCSGALRSFPEETVKLCLMPADTASVTAKGIRFKGLYYLNERATLEQWFERVREKGSWKVNISYDPRDMSMIYIRNPDGTVDHCWLAKWQEKYVGKCLYEINYLRESEKMIQRNNAPKEMASKAELSAAIDSVIAEAEDMARQTAVPKSKKERTQNIRENRRNEKEANRQTEAFNLDSDKHKQAEPTDAEVNSSPNETEEISPTLAMIKQLLEERLNEN